MKEHVSHGQIIITHNSSKKQLNIKPLYTNKLLYTNREGKKLQKKKRLLAEQLIILDSNREIEKIQTVKNLEIPTTFHWVSGTEWPLLKMHCKQMHSILLGNEKIKLQFLFYCFFFLKESWFKLAENANANINSCRVLW